MTVLACQNSDMNAFRSLLLDISNFTLKRNVLKYKYIVRHFLIFIKGINFAFNLIVIKKY